MIRGAWRPRFAGSKETVTRRELTTPSVAMRSRRCRRAGHRFRRMHRSALAGIEQAPAPRPRGMEGSRPRHHGRRRRDAHLWRGAGKRRANRRDLLLCHRVYAVTQAGAPPGPQVAASAAPASGSACVVSYMGPYLCTAPIAACDEPLSLLVSNRRIGRPSWDARRRERRALWRRRGPARVPVVCVSIRRPLAERANCGAPLERRAGQSKADRLSAFTRGSPAA
jgi:hypothetical protein